MDVYIVGAGTYGETMYELAKELGYIVRGYYDEDDRKFQSSIMGVEVVGKFSDLSNQEIKNKNFIVAIGNNEVRYEIMHKINQSEGKTPTLIHPTAIISPSVEIGIGVYIQANVYLWTKVKIGDFSILSPGVVIAHHSSIGKACLISTLSGVGASINVENLVFVGMGSTIVTGINFVGENAVIGAGAVVLDDLEKNCTYVGVPAKKISYRN